MLNNLREASAILSNSFLAAALHWLRTTHHSKHDISKASGVSQMQQTQALF